MQPPRYTVHPPSVWALKSALFPPMRMLWRPRVLHPENIPTGACFIYGNHANNMDPFLINLFTKEVTAGAMAHDHVRKGLFAALLRGIGIFPTRKQVPEPHLIRTLFRLLQHNRQIVIYPQGGRSWNGQPTTTWLPATVKLFMRAGVPIHPVFVHGSYVGWPRWAAYPRPARIKVEFLPPVTLNRKDDPEEVTRRLQALIDHDENVVETALRPKRAYQPAKGIEKLLYRDPDTGAINGLYTPDGYLVQNQAGTLKYRMHPDSRLEDLNAGTLHTTAELYDRIRALPLPHAQGGPLLRQRVDVFIEKAEAPLAPAGTHEALLYLDAVRLKGKHETQTLSLDQIQYIDIGKNTRLQLTTPDGLTELRFLYGGSALCWRDVLYQRTKKPLPSSIQPT